MTRAARLKAIAERAAIAGAKNCNVPDRDKIPFNDEVYAKHVVERVTAWTKARDGLAVDVGYLLSQLALAAKVVSAARGHEHATDMGAIRPCALCVAIQAYDADAGGGE